MLLTTDPAFTAPTTADVLQVTRKTYGGPLEMGEDLTTIQIGTNLKHRPPLAHGAIAVPSALSPPDNGIVTDQLYLSIWLDRHAQANRQRHFKTLLGLFPFSQREQPQSIVSVQAVDTTEPALLEKAMNGPIDLAEVEAVFDDYKGDDIAYQLETWWDLWQFDEEWKLNPTRVTLACFSRQFDNGTERGTTEQEDLRIDFGVDTTFLPRPDAPGSARMVESNIKSLLRLVRDVEAALPTGRRLLATESGENFAERLQQTLTASGGVQ